MSVRDPVAGAGDTRVVIVDDHQLLAQSLGVALGLAGVDCLVPDLTTVEALLAAVAARAPDLVLLDLDLGGEIGNGAALVKPLARLGPRVIVVTASNDADVRASTLEQGAAGIIDKRLPFADLLAAVVAAARGDELMAPLDRLQLINVARRTRDARAAQLAPFDQLTDREARVLRCLGEGRPVSSIARGWVVSEATVRSQVRAILTKLGVTSQLEAVAMAYRADWL